MALKDLSIRGDFRTTVEYLTVLLEAETYKNNSFTTAWLDELIANRKTEFEEPDAILNAVCGGVAKMFTQFSESTAKYRASLERGQSPSISLLRTKSKIAFIIDGYQFEMVVGLTGPESLYVKMGDSIIYGSAKSLPDGGLLIQLDGKSHVVYAKEEPLGTILTVDGKTCTLEKGNIS
jgi:acetyl-CoA carboxylase / biotin carboxylase 1